jgi:CelD/BcsL family acetyltransferase involved in cellulose biosynthesis
LAGVGHATVTLEEFKSNDGWQNAFGAPTVLWKDFAAWADYLKLLRGRGVLVDDQRRRRRLQESVGLLEFRVDDLAEDVLPTCFMWKSARDLELGHVDAFARDETRAFFHALRARGLLRASTLRGDGQLLAVWLGAVYRERWSGWVTAFNPEPSLAKYSLGRQLIYPMLEESYHAGHQEFDFSIGLEPYKLFFATHVRAVKNLGTPSVVERLRILAKDMLLDRRWMYGKAKALWSQGQL